MSDSFSSSAFAPVNIAWIKYMGKDHGLPSNSSLSMTLREIGTHTTIKVLEQNASLEFKLRWNEEGYLPPESGKKKAEAFLRNESLWKPALESLGFEYCPPQCEIEIFTRNNVPAGTGIATSASAFAALTLCWAEVLTGARGKEWVEAYSNLASLKESKGEVSAQNTEKNTGLKKSFEKSREMKSILAQIASKGSGSACRSFHGPWVEWVPSSGVQSVSAGKVHFVDLILMIDREPKAVTSSSAHERVQTSPLFLGRVERAEARLAQVKRGLLTDDLAMLQKTVIEEALDMHELFHTSNPSWSYLKPLSRDWISLVQNQSETLPSQDVVLTLDAGANVHLFIPVDEQLKWEEYIRRSFPGLDFCIGTEGTGAHYE